MQDSTTLKTHGPIDGEAWTVSDGPDLPRICHAIMIDVSGNVQVRYVSGRKDTLPNLAAGIWHPMQINQIIDAGTDPTVVHLGYLDMV